MKQRVRLAATLVKLGVAAVVSVLLFVIVINAIRNPVTGDTTTYTADFTDVSGLHTDGDVRTRGVQIGKVTSVALVRRDGRSIAEVGFTLVRPYRLTSNTVLAVKYQNLTGIRYLDLDVPVNPGRVTDHLSTAMTRPSFDITELFNGLQPVLTTLSPGEVNTFTDNAISVLQGDGGGLAPMLDSVEKLADFARDREQVISTLVTNLSRISDSLGGKSAQLVEFLGDVNIPIEKAMTVLDKFGLTALDGPQFMEPVDRLLREIGLTTDLDVDKLLHAAFSSMPAAASALRLLPVAFEGLQTPQLTASKPGAMNCAHGVARLPAQVKVLLNGSEVVICNAH